MVPPNALVILPAGARSKLRFGKVGFSPCRTDVAMLHAPESHVLYD